MLGQIIFGVVSLLVGVLLGDWFTEYLRRPKLRLDGMLSGGAPYALAGVRISNAPGLLGIRLDETVILGNRLHRFHEWGLTVNRNAAVQCVATHRTEGG